MALTETQRAQVRTYLGWPARFWSTTSQLESAMNAIDGVAEELAAVVALLVSLADIDTKITACYSRLKALKVGAITLPGHGELMALRSEGRKFTGRLAAKLGVPVISDAWSSGGPTAFAAADRMVPATGGGNMKTG